MADESTDKDEGLHVVRKKNIISGVDNDALLAGGVTLAVILGIANLPQVQDLVRNILKGATHPQQLPNNGSQLQQQQIPNPPTTHTHNPAFVEQQAVPVQNQTTAPQKSIEEIRAEQEAYAAAREEHEAGGDTNSSFLGVPERTPIAKKNQPYIPGSNVSAGL